MSEKATKSATLARWRERKKKPQAVAILRKPADAPAPLSYGQQRLWFLQKLYPGNPVYNYAETYRLRGNLNVENLLKGLEYVAQRQDILRTTFEESGEQVIQIIHDEPRIDIQKYDLQNQADQTENIRKIIKQTARASFDLEHGALTRVTLIQVAENDHLLVLAMHHIIGDRWSIELLQADWAAAYQTLQNGESLPENPLQIQYADYAYWQKKQAPYSEITLNYWTEKLSGELPVLTLPTDYPEPIKPSFKGKYTTKTFSSELSKNLIELSKTTNTTLFVLLLTAYKILLHHYSGQGDILVGTPFINRDKKELESLIGFFNETLVLRSDLSKNPRFTDLLNDVRQTVLDAFSHRNMPFETLVKTLQPERRTSANPLFRVMFLYYDVAEVPQFSSDLSLTHEPYDLGVAKFDLTLFIANKNGQLTAGIEYATDLFAPETIERMHTHLQVLLQGIISNPNQEIARVPFLSETEKQTILYDWNGIPHPSSRGSQPLTPDTRNNEVGGGSPLVPITIGRGLRGNVPNPKSSDIFKMSDDSTSIIDLFQKNVKKTPNTIAVKANNQHLTYAELNQKSNALAAELQQLGVKENTFIGLLTGRSVEMMIGILGIMKAGGAYLPLDPEYPAERIEFMLQDADVPLIVAQEKYIQNLPKTQVQILKFKNVKAQNSNTTIPPSKGQGAAYIIYTSGSTGKPKGVAVTHQNLLDSTLARFDYYPQHPGCFLLMSSFAFDSSVAGIFWSIVSGGTLLIPPRRIEQDTQELANIIYENKVTHTLLLPSLYHVLLQYSNSKKLTSLNTIMVAGEACPPSLVARHFERLPKAKLYNEYGPTEATVWCTVHEMTREDTQRVPIGRPTSNAEIYILDTHLQPVTVNVVGELYVGGSGVTQGYHRREDLTESRFVSNRFSHTHARMYRTGDLARYRADGTIDFFGRADRQVKIRGYRIEPNEIAEVVKQHPAVRDALVTVIKDEQRLCAYFLENDVVKTDDLRDFVKSQLPEYMLPAVWVLLEDFPRLPNGKINLNALPEPDTSTSISASNYVAARTSVEQKLVEIWEQVLGIQPIGIHDNFFEIGGDSILSIQIVAKAREADLGLKTNQLFEYQSIAALVQNIDSSATNSLDEEIQKIKFDINEKDHINLTNQFSDNLEEIYPLDFLQEALLFHHLQENTDEGLLLIECRLDGELHKKIFIEAWQEITQKHSALRTSIHWESIEQPLQVVLSEVELTFEEEDWRHIPQENIDEKFILYKQKTAERGLDLTKASANRLVLIQTQNTEYQLLWVCHHIFMDGWSTMTVLKDVFQNYALKCKDKPIQIETVPPYSTYLKWKAMQDRTAAETYWKSTLKGIEKPVLVRNFSIENNSNKKLQKPDKQHFNDYYFSLSQNNTSELHIYARTQRITLNTLIQGAWGMVLSRLSDNEDVLFGATLSGRNADIPNMTLMVGLFMNLLPVRVQFDDSMALSEAFNQLHTNQLKARSFDYVNLNEVRTWAGISENIELFDSIIVFENFPWRSLETPNLNVTNLEGNMTTTYPLTIAVIPSDRLDFHIRYDANLVQKELVEWFAESLQVIFSSIKENLGVLEVLERIEKPVLTSTHRKFSHQISDIKNYIEPQNQTQLELVQVWEDIFGKSPIGIQDDFFEMGGTSLMAVRLFSKIKERTEKNLAPVTLLRHRTVEALSTLISGEDIGWNTLVTLQAGDGKQPIFCIHAGGAYVLFYKGLADNMPTHQTVYAIQPEGLDGTDFSYNSMEEMTTFYLREIRKVQPKGPYHILGMCFSNAVAFEMAKQLKAMGEVIGTLVIVDSAPGFMRKNPPRKKGRLEKFIHRFRDIGFRAFTDAVQKRLPIKVSDNNSSQEQQIERVRKKFAEVFVAYEWQPEDVKITLIRSQEHLDRDDKEFHIYTWEYLSKNELDIFHVPGTHDEIFMGEAAKIIANELYKRIKG